MDDAMIVLGQLEEEACHLISLRDLLTDYGFHKEAIYCQEAALALFPQEQLTVLEARLIARNARITK